MNPATYVNDLKTRWIVLNLKYIKFYQAFLWAVVSCGKPA